MKEHKALIVFIVTLISTFICGISDATFLDGKDTIISVFAALGLWGVVISFVAALVEAFKEKESPRNSGE